MDALAQLGDWYMLFQRYGAARKTYREVESLLNKPVLIEQLRQPLELHALHPGNPEPRPDARKESKMSGSIKMSVVVGTNGRVVGRPKVLSVTPDDLIDIKYKRAARAAVYRPAFYDGEFQQTQDVQIVFDYTYTN